MPNLVLTFAELLAGAVILDAGIKGDSIANVVKGVATTHPLPGTDSTSSTSSTGSTGSTAPGNVKALAAGALDYPLSKIGKLIGFPYQGTHTVGNWESDNAVDIATPIGTPVVAVTSGTVRAGGSWSAPYNLASRFSGLEVPLFGDNGDNFFYQHLSVRYVQPGQHVTKGQVIGLSGGGNGVAHLHIAVESGNPQTLFAG